MCENKILILCHMKLKREYYQCLWKAPMCTAIISLPPTPENWVNGICELSVHLPLAFSFATHVYMPRQCIVLGDFLS